MSLMSAITNRLKYRTLPTTVLFFTTIKANHLVQCKTPLD